MCVSLYIYKIRTNVRYDDIYACRFVCLRMFVAWCAVVCMHECVVLSVLYVWMYDVATVRYLYVCKIVDSTFFVVVEYKNTQRQQTDIKAYILTYIATNVLMRIHIYIHCNLVCLRNTLLGSVKLKAKSKTNIFIRSVAVVCPKVIATFTKKIRHH